jgi:inosine/xanthosine triphosphate pyrophosphatase family protein
MPQEEKNKISHRTKAIEQLVEFLKGNTERLAKEFAK